MNIPTTLTQQELSSIKRALFDMLRSSGKLDEPDYQSLGEALDNLSFNRYWLDDYAIQLYRVVEDMIELDDLAFDLDQLHHFQRKL